MPAPNLNEVLRKRKAHGNSLLNQNAWSAPIDSLELFASIGNKRRPLNLKTLQPKGNSSSTTRYSHRRSPVKSQKRSRKPLQSIKQMLEKSSKKS